MSTQPTTLDSILQTAASHVQARIASRQPATNGGKNPKAQTSPGQTRRGTRINGGSNPVPGTSFSRSYVLERVLETTGATRAFMEQLDKGWSATLFNFKTREFEVINLQGVYIFRETYQERQALYAKHRNGWRQPSAEPTPALRKLIRASA